MQAYVQRYDGRTVSATRAIDALEYALGWAAGFDGDDAAVGVMDILNMVTLGLATYKPADQHDADAQVAA